MKVLLVDDDDDIRSLLKVVLASHGHDITECSDAPSALEECQREAFPLMILDWELGEMNGIELCRRIRSLPHGDESVILMFTARSSPDDLQMILDAGADDYLQKPFDIKWLKIRLKISVSHSENKLARKIAERQLAAARAKEIDTGSRIQQSLLLGKPPEDFADVEFFAHSIPSQKIDGDFYDFYKHNDRCFDVVVGDVMGKGIPAALLGAGIKSQFLQALQELKAQTQGAPPDLPDILRFVQMKVTKQLIELGKFVTLSYARFYRDERRVELINCGHPRTIHYHAADDRSDLISGDNLPLGVIGNDKYKEISIPLQTGDLILFYSDGLTESRHRNGDFYGEKRLAEFVKTNRGTALPAFGEALYREIHAFAEGGSAKDDCTCVAVRLCETATGERTEILEATSALHDLKRIRDFVQSFCERIAAEHGVALDPTPILLAVNEAASNVMRHAYRRQPEKPLRLRATGGARRVEFCIEHRGEPFMPPELDPGHLDTPEESGMGLYIIDEIMDDVQYIHRDDGTNAIRMIKHLARNED